MVKAVSKGLEKDRERAIAALCSATDRTLSTWVVGGEKNLSIYIGQPCHAALQIPKGTTLFASCFNTLDTKETTRGDKGGAFEKGEGEKYWSFMTGENSPWKLLFERSYPERIEKDGELVGFFLDPVAAHEKFKLCYNFCIAMRMVGEERSTIKTWSELVDFGMREADALYLARMIKPVGEHWGARDSNDSRHWPLLSDIYEYSGYNYKYTKAFNFKRFREGDYEFGHQNEVRGWITAPPRDDFSLGTVKKAGTKNYESVFKLEDIISGFTQWVDAQEIEEKRKEAA